ncbi:MAG: hypothetical protein HWD61_02655 [Parachlamydiaceae bacterium]|nr:MAG: hypothetical protein HWD61_02655 [Parachlamydiaceae bacterium]
MTRLLIGMTGTVGVLTMPPYLLALRQHFSEIKLIMTYSATQFVPKESFGMFVNGVYTHEFPFQGKFDTYGIGTMGRNFCYSSGNS